MPRLKVTVERIDGYCNLPMLVGDYLLVEGSRLTIPEGKHFCLWALQSMMPIFPLLQRTESTKGDWTGKVNQFCCPDPRGLVHYRIEKLPD
ncbi:MAG: TIGR04076 family protein [Thermodesulfobacteriota bacterium]